MKDIKDLFKRYYTKELENNKDKIVYDLFEWTKRDVFLKNHKTGKVLVERSGVSCTLFTKCSRYHRFQVF